MIIFSDSKFIETKFKNEDEVEELVLKNSEHFFGPSSILIPKKLIKTKDGFGTIPDGFAIDLALKTWYIVEAELAHHSVWTHIAPQVTKQLLAANRPETRQILIEIVIDMVQEDESVREKFEEENIRKIDIRKVLAEIFDKQPILGMPIDTITTDLKEWAETLKNDIRLWLVKKYARFGKSDDVAYEIPEEYKPVFETTDRQSEDESKIKTYDVSLSDLIEAGYLETSSDLILEYKPRGGNKKKYKAKIEDDGSLTVLDNNFQSPSYAAIYCIQQSGSNRNTVNGWTSWKVNNGKYLSQLRDEFIIMREKQENQKEKN